MEKLLLKIEAMVRAQEMIYKAVIQTVLLCSSKSWVVMEALLKV